MCPITCKVDLKYTDRPGKKEAERANLYFSSQRLGYKLSTKFQKTFLGGERRLYSQTACKPGKSTFGIK